MNGEPIRPDKSLQSMFATHGRPLGWWMVGANLAGACIVTSYFVFFDRVFPVVRIQTTFYVVAPPRSASWATRARPTTRRPRQA